MTHIQDTQVSKYCDFNIILYRSDCKSLYIYIPEDIYTSRSLYCYSTRVTTWLRGYLP